MPLSFLHRRLSVPSRQLGPPGPDDGQLRALLEAAIRVPDHGRLVPYRLLLIRGDARHALGEALAQIRAGKDPETKPAVLTKDRERFASAPFVVAVIARVLADHKIPEIEQRFCAGCVASNLLLGAQALGFGAQWLTGWAAYDADVAHRLGLTDNESIVGFVHVGSVVLAASDRPRVQLDDVLGEWTG